MSLKKEFFKEDAYNVIERYNNWESMSSISKDYLCSYNVTFSSRDTIKLLEILYKNADIYLNRKYERANRFISKYKNKTYEKRRNKVFNGSRKTLNVNGSIILFADYLKRLDLLTHYNIIYNRVYILGWSIERSMTTSFKEGKVTC